MRLNRNTILLALVGLGQHGGACLLQNLVAGHVGGFDGVIGIHDAAVGGGGIHRFDAEYRGGGTEGRHVGAIGSAGGGDQGDIRIDASHGQRAAEGCLGTDAGDRATVGIDDNRASIRG